MIYFNLSGLLIFVSSVAVVFPLAEAYGDRLESLDNGAGAVGMFILMFFLSSLLALLFDRSDVKGVLASYRDLGGRFYEGRLGKDGDRVAVVLVPLALSPWIFIPLVLAFWVADLAFLAPPPVPAELYLLVLAMAVGASVLSLGFAYLTQSFRLLR